MIQCLLYLAAINFGGKKVQVRILSMRVVHIKFIKMKYLNKESLVKIMIRTNNLSPKFISKLAVKILTITIKNFQLFIAK